MSSTTDGDGGRETTPNAAHGDPDAGVSRGLALVLLAATSVYLAAAFSVRPQFSEGLVGPRFLPILAALLVYAALLFELFVHRGRTRRARGDTLTRPAMIVGATALYVLAFSFIGYVAATVPFVVALFAVFGFREGQWFRRLAYAGAMTAVFYALFAGAFGIRLPKLAGLI